MTHVNDNKARVSPEIDKPEDPIVMAGGIARDFEPKTGKPDPIHIAELMAKTFPPLKWIVPDVLPEGLSLLAGPSKIGKSWMALDLALAVSMGRCFLGYDLIQGDVLYWALEDGQRRIKSRIQTLFAGKDEIWTESRLHIETAENLPPVLDQGGRDQIERWCLSVPAPRLVIIDVLEKVRPEKRGNESEYGATYRALQGIHSLANRLGISVLVIHHTRKGDSGGDAFDKVNGTRALTSMPDATLVIDRDTSGYANAILYGRGRDLQAFDLALDFNECRWKTQGDKETVCISKERKAILEALRSCPEGLGPKELAGRLGKGEGATSRLLGKMSVANEVKKLGRGLYVPYQD